MLKGIQGLRWGGAFAWRRLVWCGLGGVVFMFVTSLLGVVISPHMPERWVAIRAFPASEFGEPERLWHIHASVHLGWSDVMGSRSPVVESVEVRQLREQDARSLPRGVASDRIWRGKPFPVVRAGGSVWWREYSTGWPLRAWRGSSVMYEAPGGYTTRSSAMTNVRDPTGMTRWGFLVPYGPVWTGIVLNSLVGAVFVWTLLVVPGAVRRARRGWCGACVGCGYDLAGGSLVCPECGVGGESHDSRTFRGRWGRGEWLESRSSHLLREYRHVERHFGSACRQGT